MGTIFDYHFAIKDKFFLLHNSDIPAEIPFAVFWNQLFYGEWGHNELCAPTVPFGRREVGALPCLLANPRPTFRNRSTRFTQKDH